MHRLSEVDVAEQVATCATCGPRTPIRRKSRGAGRSSGWRCRSGEVTPRTTQRLVNFETQQYPYRAHKGDRCDRCAFVPEHACQLDVDHIDGDHENNDPSNLQTLCANCHRLKTRMDRVGPT